MARPPQVTFSDREDFSMKSKQGWLVFAAIVALGTGLGIACGEDDKSDDVDLCADVVCIDAATTCDPSDGICKCGTGDDRIICKTNEICQTEPHPACLQDHCLGVVCDGGQSCDPTDGICKCGAFPCSEGEVCSQNRCVVPDPCVGRLCPEGQQCDSSDGGCKCGGEICQDDERCDDGICVKDPCKGVHCGGKSVCNPEDRACHCGTVTGEACETGQACIEDENGAFVCKAFNLCEDVNCPGDSVCDPDHGLCRCGGIGEEFPVCKPGQVCHKGQCVGGPQCEGVECAPGFKCDPNTGDCLCGGRYCAEGETCMALSEDEDDYQCVQECDPLGGANECGGRGSGFSCYIDFHIGSLTGYCAPTGNVGAGNGCTLPHECVEGTTCFGTIEKTCRILCDPTKDKDAYCGQDWQLCQQLTFAPYTGEFGICFNF